MALTKDDVLLLGRVEDPAAIGPLQLLRRQGARVIIPTESTPRADKMRLFDGMAGYLAGDMGPPISFSGRVLPEWLKTLRDVGERFRQN